jgi:hypothetical protein
MDVIESLPECWHYKPYEQAGSCQNRDAVAHVEITDVFGRVYEHDVCADCLAWLNIHRQRVDVLKRYGRMDVSR